MQKTTIYIQKKYTSMCASPLWFFWEKWTAAVRKAVDVFAPAVEAAAGSWAKCLKKKRKRVG